MTSIGQRLQQARQARHLTLEQAAEATRIRARYLQALEADDYSVMPSAAQGRGFLRLYADFLALDIDQLLEELRSAQPLDSGLTGPGLPAATPVPAAVPEPEPLPEPAPQPEPEPAPEPAAPRETFWRAWVNRLRTSAPAPFWRRWLDRLKPPAGWRSFWRRWLPARARPAGQAEAQPAPPPVSAEKIFRGIGEQLRQRRELLGLSLPDVEQSTHVRQHYLLAMEEGSLDRLPSPVQTRGMLSNYATFLDMDVEALLLRFAEGLQAERLQRVAVQSRPASPARGRGLPSVRTFLIPDLMYGIGIVVAILTFAIWGAIRLTAQTIGEAEPTPPSISDVLLASPEASLQAAETAGTTAAADPGTALPAFTGTPQAGGDNDAPVQIYLVTTERTWMRVTVDGRVLLEGRVLPGSSLPFFGQDRIEVLVGNAAAVRLTYNGRDLGLLGNMGEVVNRIFTPNGIQTPTATALPTATPTPRFSPTPSPTITPQTTPTIFNP